MKRLIQIIFLLHVSMMVQLFAVESPEKSEESALIEAIEQVEKANYIEVSDIPENAVKTLVELKNVKELLKEKKSSYELHEALPSYIVSIETLLKDPLYENLEKQSIRELRKMTSEWKVYLTQLRTWEKGLKKRIAVYDTNRDLLENYSKLWAETHINANKKSAPQAIQDHITSVIIEIENLRNRAKAYYDAILTDINLVSTNILAINEALVSIEDTQFMLNNRVFYQDKIPYFELFTQDSFSPVMYLKSAYNSLLEKFQEVRIYLQNNTDKLWIFLLYVVLNAAFIAYFNYLYRKQKLFVREESLSKKRFFFIGRPFSTFFILIVLWNVILLPELPVSVKEFQLLIILIPIFRILLTVIPQEALKHFYGYVGLYALALIEKNAIGYELDGRTLSLFLTIGFIVFIYYLIRHKVLDSLAKPYFLTMIYRVLYLLILLLVISVFANLYGAVQLATRITNGSFVIVHASLIFYTLSIILTGYIVIILRRRISTASNVIEKFSKRVENTTTFIIKLAMLFWWFLIVTKVIGFYNYLVEFKDETLALSWTIASTTISVQSIFDFIIIILGTWFIARMVNTLLQVEVYSRFTLPRGMPTAITTVLNYLIIISGILIAFSSLGISPDQFALVFGALGVGIGFGLRNIIANFVSGIIMVFERPVQIGDTIEINNTMGKVLGIGTRSSTLKTFDGSEVIIPNADFIAKEITNWTLSDERRRKVLSFKVDFDSDIEAVMEIMKRVATAHRDVLEDPEPVTAFLGFGEYYLEFKLYFWLTENLIGAPSDIAIGIYREFKDAGVKMPLPKQQFINTKSEETE
ncbi:MAG: mechanosensitive ion channel [Campylobacterota bacterium]|nr:mechanosensitive ion channel [Campylobacterota bacterium]